MPDVDNRTREWLRGYVAQSQFINRLKHDVGWAQGKGTVKKTIVCWAIPYCFNCGDAQKGMIDALLDSVGC